MDHYYLIVWLSFYTLFYAASMPGSRLDVMEELDASSSEDNGIISTRLNQIKRWFLSHSQYLNFFTILVLASVSFDSLLIFKHHFIIEQVSFCRTSNIPRFEITSISAVEHLWWSLVIPPCTTFFSLEVWSWSTDFTQYIYWLLICTRLTEVSFRCQIHYLTLLALCVDNLGFLSGSFFWQH